MSEFTICNNLLKIYTNKNSSIFSQAGNLAFDYIIDSASHTIAGFSERQDQKKHPRRPKIHRRRHQQRAELDPVQHWRRGLDRRRVDQSRLLSRHQCHLQSQEARQVRIRRAGTVVPRPSFHPFW